LNFFFSVFAVDAGAFLGVAEYTILKALTVLLLAVRLLALATCDVLSIDIGLIRAFDCAWGRLGVSQGRLEGSVVESCSCREIRSFRLNFWQKS